VRAVAQTQHHPADRDSIHDLAGEDGGEGGERGPSEKVPVLTASTANR